MRKESSFKQEAAEPKRISGVYERRCAGMKQTRELGYGLEAVFFPHMYVFGAMRGCLCDESSGAIIGVANLGPSVFRTGWTPQINVERIGQYDMLLTSWFTRYRAQFIPGRCPRRFLDSWIVREILHTHVSICLFCAVAKTSLLLSCFLFLFCLFFSQLFFCFWKCGPL